MPSYTPVDLTHARKALAACRRARAPYYNESEQLGAPGPVREREIPKLAACLGITEDEVRDLLTPVESFIWDIRAANVD